MSLIARVGHKSSLSDEEREVVWRLLKLCVVTNGKAALLENELVDQICQHFLRILRQSKQENEAELLMLLDILHLFLANCENNPDEIVPCTEELLLAIFQLQLGDMPPTDTVTQSLIGTWQKGLRVFRQLPSDVECTCCEALVIKAARLVLEKLVKVETLERVDDLATVAVQLLRDSIKLSPAEDSIDELLPQRVFTALTPSEKQLRFLRNDYSTTKWLLVPLLERKILVSSDAHDLCDVSETVQSTLTNHQKVILFSSTLIVKTLSNSDELSSQKSDVITKESLIRLWLETSWVRHWCSCVLGISDVTEEFVAFGNNCDQTMANVLLNLNHSSSRLLQQINENQWGEALILEALTRSRSEGFLWCLALDGVLQDLRQLGVPSDTAVLLSEVQSLASLEEKECQTLNTLLSHVDGIYELKVITDQFIALMRQDIDERGFARVFAIIDGALHQWLQQTKGVEEAVLEYQLTITEILDELVEWNKTHDSLVLVNSPLHDASTSVLTINLSLIRILEKALQHCSDKMSGKHWDFILCTLAGWLQTCEENRLILTTSLKCVALCCQISSLFCTLARFFEENASKLPKVSEASHEVDGGSLTTANALGSPTNIFTEWQEFFSGTLFNAVLQLFLFHAGQYQSALSETSLWSNRVSEGLGSAVVYIPTTILKEHKFERQPQGTDNQCSHMPQWTAELLEHCLPLLRCSQHGLQFAAYHLLSKVMKEVTLSVENESETEEGVDEPIRSPPTALMELINSSCAHMTEMVHEAHVPFGEHLDMTGDTEAQIVSLALMLAWKVLLQFFRSLPQEKRVEYAKYIKQNKMVDSLLCVLFRLIPVKSTVVVVEIDDSEPGISRLVGQRTIQQLACGLFYSLLQWMPAIVRQWWNSVDKRQSAIVDKFTTSNITPQLCRREMQLVQTSSIRFDNMQVKARPNAREVAAVYTIEEISMELVVKLAPNHPLGVVSVESGKKIGVTAAQWRSWMLQMTTFLTHQNGSIMDGLILWKRNVDKRFEGVEDCMICFSVIHGSNYSLPKLSCKTCKKKFHSACLYKWFSTSNNATCPLCRNLF